MSGNTFNNTNPLAEILLSNFVSGFNTEQAGASQLFTYTDGAAFPVVQVGYGEVFIDSALTALVALPTSFPVLYDAAVTDITVIGGGSNDQAVVAASGGLTYDFNGGGGVIYTGNAPVGGVAATGDTIFLDGFGAGYVAAGEGQDTIVASSGQNYIAVGGGTNTIFLDGGSNLVATEGNDQIVMATAGAPGSATISLSGNSSVYGGVGPLLLLNGAGNSFLIPQIDNVTGANANTGPATVFGGTGGGAYYGGTDGNNIMVAGDQATTLVGGGANDVLYAFGPSSDVLEAKGASAVLVGTAGTGNNTYFADTTNAYIAGGGGSDIFVAGSGNSTMTAGLGPDQFDFTNTQGGGFDVIYGFKVGIDQVNLFGYDLDGVTAASSAFAQAAANSSGGSTFVTLGDNTIIYFLNTPQLAGNSFAG